MRITPLPNWLLTGNRPAFYDTESVTGLEAASKLYGKMNELIADYNEFIDHTLETFKEYTDATTEDLEIFQTAMRQEFQDFIDTVTLQLSGYDGSLDDFEELIERKCKDMVNEALSSGNLVLEAQYNEATESLDYVISGEVI